jgi:hypothetical protein
MAEIVTSILEKAGLTPAQRKAAEKLLDMTYVKEVDNGADASLRDQHAEHAATIHRDLEDPTLTVEKRAELEALLQWQQERQAERAYTIDPTLPRPNHLPALMTDEEFAASKAKVDSMNPR